MPSATAPGETAATDGRGVCGGAVVAAKTPLVGATRCTSASRVVFFFCFVFARGDAERFLTKKSDC